MPIHLGIFSAVLVLVPLFGPGLSRSEASLVNPTVAYRRPVPGPIVDGWRPPSTLYGPGNRGVDFATTSGEEVLAAGAGIVRFAGQVGGILAVSITHPSGIVTTYSPLTSVGVRRGESIPGGHPVGAAGTRLHWGALRDGVYFDPMTLLSDEPLRVWLVPTGEPWRPRMAISGTGGRSNPVRSDPSAGPSSGIGPSRNRRSSTPGQAPVTAGVVLAGASVMLARRVGASRRARS